MRVTKKQLIVMKWVSKIAALCILLFALPFYFGYGNPLPFINPEYTFIENLFLTIVPIMLIGLAVGWKWEKTGGYIITVPLAIGLVLGVILEGELLGFLLVPLVIGILYLIVGYSSYKKEKSPHKK